jgi:hypothetical protein
VETKAPYTEPQVRQLEDGRREVLDPVRRRWVALTPEEWVRQQMICLLNSHYGYPLELMQVEGAITLNGLSRRCDIVVFSPSGQPQIIVECKRPNVKITQKTVDQACRYNTVLKVPYLILYNGHNIIVISVDFDTGKLACLDDVPKKSEG